MDLPIYIPNYMKSFTHHRKTINTVAKILLLFLYRRIKLFDQIYLPWYYFISLLLQQCVNYLLSATKAGIVLTSILQYLAHMEFTLHGIN